MPDHPSTGSDHLTDHLASRIHIAFLGTPRGLTSTQKELVRRITRSFTARPEDIILHHGASKGADQEMHELACARGWKICIHPGNPLHTLPGMKPEAYSMATTPNVIRILPPQANMKRNLSLLDHADLLLAAPDFGGNIRASSVWATIRHAKSQYKMLRIL